jgi:sialate O-acetylesterase
MTFLCLTTLTYSQLRLPALMSSGMVLQQKDTVKLWGWAHPGEWVYIKCGWKTQRDSVRADNGAKWIAKISTPSAGGPYDIVFSTGNSSKTLSDVLIGEVWVCSGQSNMEWNYHHRLRQIKEELPVCYNPNIRFFHVPKMTSDFEQDDVHGTWEVCDSNTLKKFSAVGYFFGKRLNNQLNVPIGLINASWGGTPAEVWTPESCISQDKTLKDAAQKLRVFEWWPEKPGKTYNAMIAPLTKYNVAGAIWYQGESNTLTNSTYYPLMTTMIQAWRKAWGKELAFNLVQIAPYKYENKNVGALLQEAQSKLLSNPKTGVIVITDLVENIRDIHPQNKRDVGIRLANWALSETYHIQGIPYRSPQFQNTSIKGSKIEITFSNCPNGLTNKGNNITGFYISGAKEQWYPAECEISGNKITLWNANVAKPQHVRYGFGNTIIGNVFSTEGLPVAPFRTDHWVVDQSADN